MNFSIIEITNTDFSIENCKVYHYRNEDAFRVNIFFLEASNDRIKEIWRRFSNMIAANYQNYEYMGDSKFDKWNFYIIYLSKDIVSKELKNKIENDKFSIFKSKTLLSSHPTNSTHYEKNNSTNCSFLQHLIIVRR
jgi:hypothetical protein